MQRRLAGSLVAAMAAFVASFVNPPPVSAEVRYTVTDLTAILESSFAEPEKVKVWHAMAINNDGQIAGYAETTNNSTFAFIWDEVNGLRDLSSLGKATMCSSINNQGQSVTNGGPYLWDPDVGLQLIQGLSDAPVLCSAINDSGLVAGTYWPDCDEPHAFLWDNDVVKDLGSLGADFAQAFNLNNRGQVVGWSKTSDGIAHAFLWDATNGMNDLGTMGLTAFAVDLNDLGQVVGHGGAAVGESRVFLWQEGEMVNIDTLGGESSQASSINNLGQIVGSYQISGEDSSSAFLWSKVDGMQDINDLLPEDVGWQMCGAADINDHGRIIALGCGVDDTGYHMLLLTPVPEPTALALLMNAFVMALISFRTLNKRTGRAS